VHEFFYSDRINRGAFVSGLLRQFDLGAVTHLKQGKHHRNTALEPDAVNKVLPIVIERFFLYTQNLHHHQATKVNQI
jgi:hypothetical protein